MPPLQRLSLALATAAIAGLPSATLAQVNNPESEPNDSKTAATIADSGGAGLAPLDFLSGSSTGASTTTPGIGSADYFRVKTAAAPPGIYRNRLVITSPTAGYTGTIRGLSQTGTVAAGGTIGAADNTAQTSSTATTPPRFNQWYGFGKAEEIYYRVTGTASTTSPYTATLERTAVSPIVFSGLVTAGTVTIDRAPGNTNDTDYWLYDSDYNPVPLAGRDDGTPNATLTLNLTPGTYTLAASFFNFANNQASPPGESFFGTVLDFPNALLSSSTSTAANFNFRFTSISGAVETSGVAISGPFEVVFIQFTVSPATSLTASGSASPLSVINDGSGSTQFLVTVNPAASPPSTGIAVNLDLSSIGGGSSVAALDDGLNGDGAAGDNVFGLSYTITNGQTPGTYSVPFAVTDAQARSFNGSISNLSIFTTPAFTADLGDLSLPVNAQQTFDLTSSGDIKWFRFTLSQPAAAAIPSFLDFDTEGSTPDSGTGTTDTEIGVYTSAGALVASDDDSGTGLRSQLSFGAGTRPAVIDAANGNSLAYAGQNGDLPAGTYYLAVSRFNTIFNASGFSVTGGGTGADLATRLNYRSTLASPNISATASATPSSVLNDGSGTAQFLVTVTPADVPPSTGLAVSLNLSAIGGGSSVAAFDDGLNGDGLANDNVFGLAYTVPLNQPTGSFAIPYTVTDDQSRSFNGSINGFTITGRPAATDLGTLSAGTTPFSAAYSAGSVVWVRFDLASPVTSKLRNFLDIDTEGSILSGGSFANDTFIGLYDNNGNRLATDDDDGSGFTSQLTFGGAFDARPAPGDGLTYNGRDGERLPAGTYYLAISGFPATFGATNWAVTTTNTLSGSVNANLNLGQLAVPTPVILVGPVTNPANNNRYYLFDRTLDFWGAQAAAQALGGNLASIDDAAENEWIRVNILGFDSADRRGWIGYNDFSAEGVFEWTDGSNSTFTNWNAGEPNNGGGAGDENYAELLGSSGLWNDLNVRGIATGNWAIVELPPLFCPADFNQSNSVTVQDIFDFLAAYFAPLPSADFNNSGSVTVQDIFDFLAAYFTPCP